MASEKECTDALDAILHAYKAWNAADEKAYKFAKINIPVNDGIQMVGSVEKCFALANRMGFDLEMEDTGSSDYRYKFSFKYKDVKFYWLT